MTPRVPEPVFDNPPVAEVTLSVQFAPLFDLTAVHIGKLWETWAEDYPNTEEHDELAPLPDEATASRLAPSLHIAIRDRPLPRTWFLDALGEHVIQVQRDRLVLNWRRREEKMSTLITHSCCPGSVRSSSSSSRSRRTPSSER